MMIFRKVLAGLTMCDLVLPLKDAERVPFPVFSLEEDHIQSMLVHGDLLYVGSGYGLHIVYERSSEFVAIESGVCAIYPCQSGVIVESYSGEFTHLSSSGETLENTDLSLTSNLQPIALTIENTKLFGLVSDEYGTVYIKKNNDLILMNDIKINRYQEIIKAPMSLLLKITDKHSFRLVGLFNGDGVVLDSTDVNLSTIAINKKNIFGWDNEKQSLFRWDSTSKVFQPLENLTGYSVKGLVCDDSYLYLFSKENKLIKIGIDDNAYAEVSVERGYVNLEMLDSFLVLSSDDKMSAFNKCSLKRELFANCSGLVGTKYEEGVNSQLLYLQTGLSVFSLCLEKEE